MALANLVVGSLTLTDDRGQVQVYKIEPLPNRGPVKVVDVIDEIDQLPVFIDKVWGTQ